MPIRKDACGIEKERYRQRERFLRRQREQARLREKIKRGREK